MTVKVLDGQCGYRSGPPIYTAEVQLSETAAKRLRDEFAALDVWGLPAERPLPREIGILDGTEWCLEVRRGGEYRRIIRNSPGATLSLGTEAEAHLREVVKFDVVGYVEDGRRCKMLEEAIIKASGKELGEWWGWAGISKMSNIQQLYKVSPAY